MARTKKSMTDFKKSEIAKNKESELTKTKKSEMAKTKKSVRKTKDQENPQALIGQRLKKYRTHEEIVNLAHRLFQKCPSIIEALQNKVEQSHDSDKVRIASEDTLRLIGLALQKRIKDEKYEIVHFPTNPENYLSFCDLTEVVLHPERKMWHTFVMQDQTDVLENLHGPEGSLPLWKIRKSLKKKLNEDKLASVQMDLNNETGIPTVFLRIATTPKIKNIKKAERNLLTVKPTFLVYFPGEQYFYADSSVPNENHCQALVEVLKCSAYEEIPLIGRHVESLRQLRLNRDQPENIDHELWMDTDQPLPTLNLFTVSAVNDMTCDGKRVIMEDFKSSIEIKGHDVLNGLREISQKSKEIISQPPPSWIQKAVYRGRHQICIKPKKKTLQTSTPSRSAANRKKGKNDFRKSRIVVEDDFQGLDEMSMVSDRTVYNRR